MRTITRRYKKRSHTGRISDDDISAIRRWENRGALTPDAGGWGDLSPEEQEDAGIAMYWDCHGCDSYEID